MTYWMLLAMMMLMVMQYHTGCASSDSSKFTLEEVLSQTVKGRGFNGTWTSGTEFLYIEELTGNVMLYDVTSQAAAVLVVRSDLADYNATSFLLTPDGQYLLIGYDEQSIFRHSYLSRYVLYDVVGRNFNPLHGGELLQKVVLAPQGNALVYVFENDVYYKRSAREMEQRITFTGEDGVIFNGITDWIYEEEVMSERPVMSISPSCDWLVFASFNDTNVKSEAIPFYGEPGTLESQYPKMTWIRYPKPGTPNPSVTLHAVDLRNVGRSQRVDIVDIPAPIETVTEDHILGRITWVNELEVAVVWANRVQNVAVVMTCVPENGTCQELYGWNETAGWVTLTEPLFDNRGRVVTVLPQPQKPGEGNFEHLTLFNRKGNAFETMSTETPLTSGRAVVTALYGWDMVNDIIYYQATPEDEPTQLQVYALSMAERHRDPECLSCNISSEGNLCRYASAYFSTDFSHLALTCSGPDPTQVFILRAPPNLESVTTWENNTELREFLVGKHLPNFMDLRMAVEDGLIASVRLWLPPDADLSGDTKYPLLIYVYGGPNSVLISDQFTINWGTYLVTNRSIIYAMIDGRGSGYRGDNIKFSVYRRLGTNEIYDQLDITRRLQNTYSFIDAKRTAIWGWSYGGYATAMTLARDDKDVFKCGISVAPVTSWIYYDTVYTERYMGLPSPEDNLDGYNNGDVTRLTGGFRNKSFYLIHGNADDNVHYLQSMMLSRALELKGILFRQQMSDYWDISSDEHDEFLWASHVFHERGNPLMELSNN